MKISKLYPKLERFLPGKTNGAPPSAILTDTQRMFIEWNAERLGVSEAESARRFASSMAAVKDGHSGSEYSSFCKVSYEIYQVFNNDSAREIYDSYRIHGPMHFLRMLGYKEPVWSEEDAIVRKLLGRSHVDILDYGCGLAQRSRSLATFLARKGVAVSLHLADIPTIRKEFLLWLGKKSGISIAFLECTAEKPIPDLPASELVFANDFFEHVFDPILYFERFHASLKSGGLIEANIDDQEEGYMHVSPNLGKVREKIRAYGYKELSKFRLYEKN
jgi:hypothetical protein